jgi:hypothetical protein
MKLKRSLFAAVLLAAAAVPAFAQVAVGVGIGEPGFYGRINIGGGPPPQVINAAPVIIAPGPVAYPGSPIYLRVPYEHQRNWRRYCANYGACGQPVFFVHEDWYRNVYAPRYYHHDDRRYYDHDHHDHRY